jgi:hypothetical protein
MATLTKTALIDVLSKRVADMEGSDAEIAEALNAPTATGGVTYAELDSEVVLDIIGADAYSALETAAAAGDSAAAAQLLGYLAYPGTLAVEPETGGRSAVDACVVEKLISAETGEALVAAGEGPDMSGESWGQANGIGYVHTEFLKQVR